MPTLRMFEKLFLPPKPGWKTTCLSFRNGPFLRDMLVLGLCSLGNQVDGTDVKSQERKIVEQNRIFDLFLVRVPLKHVCSQILLDRSKGLTLSNAWSSNVQQCSVQRTSTPGTEAM